MAVYMNISLLVKPLHLDRTVRSIVISLWFRDCFCCYAFYIKNILFVVLLPGNVAMRVTNGTKQAGGSRSFFSTETGNFLKA